MEEKGKAWPWSYLLVLLSIFNTPENAGISTCKGGEAGAGIEPADRGFADPGLTTWLSRRRKGWEDVGEEGAGVNRQTR